MAEIDLRREFGLNTRQEAFVLSVHGNPRNEDATSLYWRAYRKGPLPKMESKPYMSASAAASRLLKDVKIVTSLQHLRQKTKAKAIANHTRRLEILTLIMEHGESEGDRIRAIHEANLMDGGHCPEEIEVNHSGTVTLRDMLLNAQAYDIRS